MGPHRAPRPAVLRLGLELSAFGPWGVHTGPMAYMGQPRPSCSSIHCQETSTALKPAFDEVLMSALYNLTVPSCSRSQGHGLEVERGWLAGFGLPEAGVHYLEIQGSLHLQGHIACSAVTMVKGLNEGLNRFTAVAICCRKHF